MTERPISTTGWLRDGDGTYRCDDCGATFNGRYLHHFCGDAAGTIAPDGDDLGSAPTRIPTSDAP